VPGPVLRARRLRQLLLGARDIDFRLAEVLLERTLSTTEECGRALPVAAGFEDQVCAFLDHPAACPHGRTIPPGDSWTVVRYGTAFSKSDVQEFKVARSLITIGEVSSVRVASQSCAGDPAVGTIGCDFAVESSVLVPAFSKLHLVVVVRTKSLERPVLSMLQWRPELAGTGKPWLNLFAGDSIKIQMHDSYPTPSVPWEYEVFVHTYQYSSQ